MSVVVRAIASIAGVVIERILASVGSGVVGCSKTGEMAFWQQDWGFGHIARMTVARRAVSRTVGVVIRRILGFGGGIVGYSETGKMSF